MTSNQKLCITFLLLSVAFLGASVSAAERHYIFLTLILSSCAAMFSLITGFFLGVGFDDQDN